MARGKGSGKSDAAQSAMPRFVDVSLTAEQREQFKRVAHTESGLIQFLTEVTDSGYRVGVSWSGEHQSYTVSLTCRDPESPNNGLCMTSFAGRLDMAIALCAFKHRVVCGEVWVDRDKGRGEDFG